MTVSIKNPAESNNPGKPDANSQNSQGNSGQSPRTNPVCLELGVSIRSLPSDAGGQAQPIREEGKTVIVFDNGAVLRSEKTLPIGQTFILSNPNGRDVVCKVVGGRNLPSVKGYVEVEFIEPAKDFWNTNKESSSAAFPAPPAPSLATREVPPVQQTAPQPVPPPRVAAPVEPPAKPASVTLGSAPSFEDIPGLMSVPAPAAIREQKISSMRPGPIRIAKEESDYNHDISKSTSIANWDSSDAALPTEKHAMQAMKEALSTSSTISPPPRDFMSKGLMAYEQSQPAGGSSKRMPLILGLAAIVVLGVCGGVYWMRQGPPSAAPVAESNSTGQTSDVQSQLAKSAPAHAPAPAAELAQTQTRAQAAEPVGIDQGQSSSANAPVPAVVTSTETASARSEQSNSRRQQEENAANAKQASAAAPRRPSIPNLKLAAPSAPNQNAANLTDGAAPLTEISSTEAIGDAPATGLLTSAGRTSNAPAPPPSPVAPAPVARVVRDPKLISSTKPVYPPTARQTGVQGSVSVTAHLDETGKVTSATAISGPMLLRQAAVDSVKQWKYNPGTIDGKPTPTQISIAVEFRMN